MGKHDKLTIRKGNRAAIVVPGTYMVYGKYVVHFYYDGYPDYEWKRGSDGIPCDICDTREQAIRKAKYYVNKF